MIIVKHYAVVDENGFVTQSISRKEDDELEVIPPTGGCSCHPLDTPIVWACPTPTSKLTWADGSLIWQEMALLEDMKAVKNSEINAARLSANRSTFPFSGKDIACDELSRSDIDAVNGVVSLIGVVPITQWKAVDNTYIAIPDKATWIQFYMAMVSKGSSNFAHAQALKVRLAAATTFAEVEAITW